MSWLQGTVLLVGIWCVIFFANLHNRAEARQIAAEEARR